MHSNHLSALGSRIYRNPLQITHVDAAVGSAVPPNPDPYVLKYNGAYYCYPTGHDGVPVFYSTDLVRWESKGLALSQPEEGYWAPCVVYRHGLFYMYYSSGMSPAHFQWMKVAVSKHPLGPFEPAGTLFERFSIDAHVVQDEDGSWYLFYSVDDYAGADDERPGTVILVDRLLDMTTPAGQPALVVAATLNEEISGPDRFGDGRDWHTIEGAYYLRRGDARYLMYSGNSFEREHYFVGYATSRGDGSIGSLAWSKWPANDIYEPLLRKSDAVEGTGHHSVATAPNLADSWIVYHGRDIVQNEAGEGERRQLRIDPLLWQGERLWVPGPTDDVQDAPGMPAFRELFAGEGELADTGGWEVTSGQWTSHAGFGRQTDARGTTEARIRGSWDDFLFEGSARWLDQMPGGRFGFRFASVQDGRSGVDVLVDAGRREAVVSAERDGIRSVCAKVKLAAGFEPAAFHRWNVRKSGGQWSVRLDDLPIFDGVLDAKAGRIAMITHFTGAEFAGLAITRHYETDFRSADSLVGRFACSDSGGSVDPARGLRLAALGGRAVATYTAQLPDAYIAELDISFEQDGAGGRLDVAIPGLGREISVDRTAGRTLSVYVRQAESKLQVWANGKPAETSKVVHTAGGERIGFAVERAVGLLTRFRVTEWK
ncbi:glycoside hydrolase family 43 protein [Cohnella sp. GCM10012308]|uniref:glycoside hydrolase family 43 protein n=1 Tax=Cohnella sp. GCM10012308 TaxID=3317329 RepID=UPI00361BB1CC